jgi:hypothetical protein
MIKIGWRRIQVSIVSATTAMGCRGVGCGACEEGDKMMVVSVVATLIEVVWGLGEEAPAMEANGPGVTQHVGLSATAGLAVISQWIWAC